MNRLTLPCLAVLVFCMVADAQVFFGNGINDYGGPVMVGTHNVYYIWYGNWSGSNAPNILIPFATGLNNSAYLNTDTTYFDNTVTAVANSVLWNGQVFDSYSQGTTLTDAGIANVVSHAMNTLPVDQNGIFFVLTSPDVNMSLSEGAPCTNICGFHTHSTMFGRDIKYAWVGNPNHCSFTDHCARQAVSPNGNPDADFMASVMAHELNETITDPDLNAWKDSSRAEVGDKCLANYGTTFTTSNGAQANITLGGLNFLIQRNWTNASGGFCSIGFGTPPTITSGQVSCGTSYASFNGILYQAWTGLCTSSAPGTIMVAAAAAGTRNFNNAITLQETSFLPPALAVFNNRLYLAWTGTDNQLNVMSSADGVTWSESTHVRLGQFTFFAPSLAAFNGRLYLGFTNSNTNLNSAVTLISSADGANFNFLALLPPFSNPEFGGTKGFEQAIRGPALTTFNGRLFVAWSNIPVKLNFASTSDGFNFTNRAEIPSLSVRVAATATASGLVIAFEDGNNGVLGIVRSSDGIGASNPVFVSGTVQTSQQPALSPPLFSQPFVAWISQSPAGSILSEPL